MMSDRERMLADVRDAVRRSPLSGGPEPAAGREADGRSSGASNRLLHPVPGRARVTGEERVGLFVQEATAVETTVDRVGSEAEVPAAVAAYLRDAGLEPAANVRGGLVALDWNGSGVDPEGGPAEEGGPAVLEAFAGVAETGSVCLTSTDAPLDAAFLPDTLVVVLREDDLFGSYDALWSRGREAWGGEMPSTVVWMAGPSRTADIQQTLVLGAHGPRRLHVVLVGSMLSLYGDENGGS